MFYILLAAIALIALIIASISDIKTKEIPDYLSYSALALALFIRLIYSLLTGNYILIIYALIAALLAYLIGLLMFYARIWGGGDVKLLIALSVYLPTNPNRKA